MNKWPHKIQKTKAHLIIDDTKVSGEAWLDRWHENIWFFAVYKGKYKLFVPFEVNRILKTMSFDKVLNFSCQVIYGERIVDLIYNINPLLKTIPEYEEPMYKIPAGYNFGLKQI